MDPDACFSMILASIADEEWLDAANRAEDLRDWLTKGGFPPGGGKLRQASIDDLLAWLICYPDRHQ